MEVAVEKIVRIASLTRLYFPIIRLNDSGVRTKLQRLEHRHGRVHAEGASHIAGRDDNTASARMADDQRLAGELRPVALLDGGVEGIAIDVGDTEALDLHMRQQPRAAAPDAHFGGAGDDFTAIPAQRTRHGSRSIGIVFPAFHAASADASYPGAALSRHARHGQRPILCTAANARLPCGAEPEVHTHSMPYACELPPPCAPDDAYYVSRARLAGPCPALLMGLALNHLEMATRYGYATACRPRGG